MELSQEYLERKIQEGQILDLSYRILGVQGANFLSTQLFELFYLNLECCSIGLATIPDVSRIISNSRIKTLNLNKNYFTDFGAKCIAEQLPGSLLESLSLQENCITSYGAADLAHALEHSNLITLDLSLNNITNPGASALAQVIIQSKLKALYLHCNLISFKGLCEILNRIPESSIEELEFHHNPLTEELNSYLIRLETLNFQSCSLSLRAMGTIVDSLSLNTKVIDFSENELKFEGPVLYPNSYFHKANSKGTTNSDLNQLTEIYLNNQSTIKLEDFDCSKLTHAKFGYIRGLELLPKFRFIYLDLSSPEPLPKINHICTSDLTYLNLSERSNLTTAFSSLPKALINSKIEKLYLKNCRIKNKFLKKLLNAISKRHVKELDLEGNFIGDKGVECLALHIPNWPITYLNLGKNKLTNKSLEFLSRSVPISELQHLDLAENSFGRDSNFLIQILNTSNLKSINLKKTNGTAEVRPEFFFALFTRPTLSKVNLSGAKVLHFEETQLDYLTQKYSLTFLEPGKCLEPPKNSELIDLVIGGARSNLGKILALISPRIKKLSLNHTNDPRVLEFLSGTLVFSQMWRLSLRRGETSQYSIELLCQSLKYSNLRYLDLSSTRLSYYSVSVIAQSLESSRIACLDLSGNNGTSKGVECIAEALPYSSLTCLSLNYSSITSKEAIVLANSLPYCQLAYLYLGKNYIGYGGAHAFSEAIPRSHLLELGIQENPIGDIGAYIICTQLPKSKITRLNASWEQRVDKYQIPYSYREQEYYNISYKGSLVWSVNEYELKFAFKNEF